MYAEDIKKLTKENTNFRKVLHTGQKSQIVAMSIPFGSDIGEEVHPDTDQIIFIVDGSGEAIINGEVRKIEEHDVIFVPAGTTHNFKNIGDSDLKIFTVYSPPEHPDGTIHATREDAQKAEEKGDYMKFLDRTEAGKMLAEKLSGIKDEAVVYAIPRGGVQTAVEIARHMNAPLDLIIARKVSHPNHPEFAIAATAENGHGVYSRKDMVGIDEDWLEEEVNKQREEAKRRRMKYLHAREFISPEGKVAIIVDDGVATGLTLRVGVLELKHRKVKKIIAAIPVLPKSTADIIRSEVDELIALEIPADDKFLGAVGAYYDSFPQLEDEEVVAILDKYQADFEKENLKRHLEQKEGKDTTVL